MLVSVPHILLVFDAFDQLLKVLNPESFSKEWWASSGNKDIRLELHYDIIESFNDGGVYFPIEHFRDGSLNNVKIFSLPIDFQCSDFDEVSHFAVPLYYWSSGDLKKNNDIIHIIHEVLQDIQSKYHLNQIQSSKILEHHLIMTYLIQQFSRNEKWGADFFTNDYPIWLLQNAFNDLNLIQAQRFYYWGILRFRVSDHIDYWISPDAFKNYLTKFKD